MTGVRRRFWAAHAFLAGGVARDVTFVVDDGRFTAITPGTAPGDSTRLPGAVLPGFADVHSHAFHRALRGRTHDRGGTFWTWRDRMYTVAARLDPDSYLALARAAFAERALAGVTAVGEFHYLHHAEDGRPYADPNAMGHALAQAATDAGIRLTLLDTCYLAADVGIDAGARPVEGVQRRFSDGSVDAWAERVAALRDGPGLRIGVAAHSVRAVPRTALRTVAGAADGRPLHVHLSEQPAENAACLAVHGLTPTGVLAAEGLLGPATTAVHATHLTAADVAVLGGSGTTACLCPTTEADLADGLGPARALRDAGCPLALGGDQHALTDPFAEARGLEMHERLASGERGRFTPADLLDALTAHSALGRPDAGRLAVGACADLVAVRLDTPRTAGADPGQVMLAASAADVDTVVVDGDVVVSGGRHLLGDVGALLQAAIEPLWEDR
ncbi:MAG: formimidoylglutamate deiminase [Pseudonocardia sp.]|nr:formimidoylglutamate deiminase [Pseudonocardia sp.]